MLLYEMAVGISPFFSNDEDKITQKIVNSKVIWPDPSKEDFEWAQFSEEFKHLVTEFL